MADRHDATFRLAICLPTEIVQRSLLHLRHGLAGWNGRSASGCVPQRPSRIGPKLIECTARPLSAIDLIDSGFDGDFGGNGKGDLPGRLDGAFPGTRVNGGNT